MELNDLVTLKSLEGGMSPYEQVKVGYMQAKRPSGVGIGGLVTGVAGVVLAAGVGLWAAAKSAQAREAARAAQDIAAAQNAGTAALLNRVANQYDQLFATERAERIAGDLNITNTITDTQSGSQQGSLSQSQQLSNELTFGLMTGRYSENPQRVALYQDAKPCACPVSCGCGCNA